MPKKTPVLHETRTLLGTALAMILILGGWAYEIWDDVDSVQGTIADNAALIGGLTELEDASFEIVDAVAVQFPTLPPGIDGGILCRSLATSREVLTDALRIGSTDAYPELGTIGALNDRLEIEVFSLGTTGDAQRILETAHQLRDVSRQAVQSIRTQQQNLANELRGEWRELLGLLAVCAVCALVLGVCFVTAQRELIRKQSTAEELSELNVALVHAMPGVSRLRPDGTYEFVNQPFAQAVGRTPAELVNQHWESTVAAEDRAAARAGYTLMRRDGKAEVELRGLRKDGSTFYQQIMMVSRLDPLGRFIGHHCFMRDITERKRTEQRLREAEQRYRTIFEQAGVGVARIDSTSGRFLDVNRRYCEITGRSDDEMLTTTFMALTHPDDLDEDLRGLDRMLSGEIRAFSMAKRYVRPDQTIVWVNLNVVPLWQPGESPTSHIAVVEDITETKRVAMELRETNERFRQMAESIDEVFWLTDWRDRRILYVSPAYETVWERPCRSLYDDPRSWDRDIDPEDRPKVRSAFDRDAETGGYDVEYRLNCRSGTTRWIRDRAFPIKDERGRVVRMAGLSEDITERKRTEAAMRASEERYRQLFERDSVAVFYSYLQDGEIECNDAFVRMFGYESKADLLTHPVADLYRSGGERDAYLTQLREAKQLENFGMTLRRKDGTQFEVLENVALLRDDAGREYIQGTIIDVTRSRHAERALRESEARNRLLIESSPICIHEMSLDGRILSMNPAGLRMLGLGCEGDVIGQSMLSVVAEQDLPRVKELLAQAVAGRTVAFDYIATKGRVFRKTIVPDVGTDNHVRRLIGWALDITDSRRAEERLQASQAHLVASQRIARVGSWELDLTRLDQLDPNPLRWTDEAFRVFGYEPGEVEPSNDLFWARVHPDDRPKVEEAVRRAIETRSVYEIDHRIVLPDGSQRVIHERAELVLDPATGSPLKFIGTSQDISEHRLAEEKVRQRERELAHFARVSVMGEMASGLAHEVNQPLTAVVNYCRGAKIRLGKRRVEDPELIAAIDDAGREAYRAAEIIRGLARFVQKRDPRQAKIRVNPTIQEAVLLAAAEAKKAKARIELDLSLENPNVLADDVQIQQVLLNLVRNGLEAMDRVPASDRVVKVRTAVVENCVRVAVSDCGIGLSGESRELVFQPFYTTKRDGMGMGLPISKSIIDAHGGRMWVTPNEKQGVTFEFTLPVTS